MEKSERKIIEMAYEMEKRALRFYRDLSKNAETEALSQFWRGLAVEEARHLSFWRGLLHHPEKIEPLFQKPEIVAREIEQLLRQAMETTSDYDTSLNIEDAFLRAIQLEFYFLHPAFEAMFLLLDGPGDVAGTYSDHLNGLIQGYEKFGARRPEVYLLGALINRLLESNRLAARRLADIRTLQGLLPICMHCNKIYDEGQAWTRLETYIEKHSHAEFTHGLCPDCMVKYYGEYLDDK